MNLTNNNQSKLLDVAIKAAKLKNDAALGRLIGTSPPVISKVRNGKLRVGATMLVRLHEETGLAIGDMKTILIGGAHE